MPSRRAQILDRMATVLTNEGTFQVERNKQSPFTEYALKNNGPGLVIRDGDEETAPAENVPPQKSLLTWAMTPQIEVAAYVAGQQSPDAVLDGYLQTILSALQSDSTLNGLLANIRGGGIRAAEYESLYPQDDDRFAGFLLGLTMVYHKLQLQG